MIERNYTRIYPHPPGVLSYAMYLQQLVHGFSMFAIVIGMTSMEHLKLLTWLMFPKHSIGPGLEHGPQEFGAETMLLSPTRIMHRATLEANVHSKRKAFPSMTLCRQAWQGGCQCLHMLGQNCT